jgi:glutamine synthetase
MNITRHFPAKFETKLLNRLSDLSSELFDDVEALKEALAGVPKNGDNLETATYYKTTVLEAMKKARSSADEIEKNLGLDYAPFPSYSQLLFKI